MGGGRACCGQGRRAGADPRCWGCSAVRAQVANLRLVHLTPPTPQHTHSDYKYYIFLNSSVRGPFVPSYMPHDWQWTNAFTDRLRGDVKAVGSSLVCLPEVDAGELWIQRGRLSLQLLCAVAAASCTQGTPRPARRRSRSRHPPACPARPRRLWSQARVVGFCAGSRCARGAAAGAQQ